MELKIGKAGGRDFYIDAQELVTGRTCIIAQSGAGKSWSIAVLCEKMCRNNIGFCLIDTEGEYYSLKEKYDNIWWIGAEGGDSECDGITMDYDIEKVNIQHILQRAVSESRPVIYDVSEVEMIPRVTKMVHALYDVATEQRKPYLLIVEESDKFIPQSKDSIKKIEEISRRGRKRGLGMMVATQRPAIVTKNVLSQCNNQIIGKLSIENDLKAVGLFFSSKQEVEELTTLNPGDFFVMGNLVREKTKMRFGKRETQHRGLTPVLEYREISDDNDSGEQEEPEVDIIDDLNDGDYSVSSGNKENDVFTENETDTDRVTEAIAVKSLGHVSSPAKKTASQKGSQAKKKKALVAEKIKKEAVIPVVERDEALKTASKKLKKSRLGLGSGEKLLSADLVYIPIVKVSIKYIGGILKKSTRKASFLIDGRNGAGVNLSRGLSFRSFFSEYVGLDESSVVILSLLPIKGDTLAGIEAQSGLDKKTVERSISSLEKKRLITRSETIGESEEPVYVPLVSDSLPVVKPKEVKMNLRMGHLEEGTTEKRTVEESDMRTVLKVVEPTSEITDYYTFYYPMFRVTAASGYEERTVYIDAVTGKEVFPDEF
ncbi:putative transcriptional regulator [Methanomicrobium sp. W14]|uniref:ATP-binding protein n=1 Tax=Methanomicrobium sp. W14 TaxID=2817839 RepID=UPI001AE9FBCB|nr:DUF87 domain-containing protein [Methanomicrobium sp. W14]MBP2132874.1 putative transcriptional regulator [Methanomicrobium sp. W14]